MADITITNDELRDPSIDDVINLEKSLQQQTGERIEDIRTPFYLNPIFYYSTSSLIGALTVWAIAEPYITDDDVKIGIPFVSDYLIFGPVAAGLGLTLGLVYGVVNRNWSKALRCGIVGLGVGMGVTILTTVVADIAFGISIIAATSAMGNSPSPPVEGEFPLKGLPFFLFMCGRGIAWAIISMGAGLGLGVALKSKQLLLNGMVGGLIGGLLGGLFFDPISRWVAIDLQDGWVSRCVGFAAVGLFVGLFIGLIENISKEAWFQMLKGPLAGKHFVLFKSPMIIGSSPKCDIYLFKDPDIAPNHASVLKSGTRYLLKDDAGEQGVFVNGRKIDRHLLQPGDTVTIGETVLRYHEKQSGS